VVVAACSALYAAASGSAALTLRGARRLATRPGRCVAERRAADLVKLLALAPGHRMPRDELLEMLWPKLGADPAPSNLHKAASYALMRRLQGGER
jgi:DNA-binding SARP family transcriptional activator